MPQCVLCRRQTAKCRGATKTSYHAGMPDHTSPTSHAQARPAPKHDHAQTRTVHGGPTCHRPQAHATAISTLSRQLLLSGRDAGAGRWRGASDHCAACGQGQRIRQRTAYQLLGVASFGCRSLPNACPMGEHLSTVSAPTHNCDMGLRRRWCPVRCVDVAGSPEDRTRAWATHKPAERDRWPSSPLERWLAEQRIVAFGSWFIQSRSRCLDRAVRETDFQMS